MPKKISEKPKKVVVKKEEKKEYHISISFNDETFEFDTNDIRESILSVAPQFLRTRVILKITKGDKTLDRLYHLQQGKQLFVNRYAIDVLLKNLIF